MDKYRINGPLTLPVGAIMDLTDEQVAAREHALEKVGKHYRAKLDVQFKAGEEIGYDGELPKAFADLMKPTKAQEKAAAKEVADKAESTPVRHVGPQQFAKPPE